MYALESREIIPVEKGNKINSDEYSGGTSNSLWSTGAAIYLVHLKEEGVNHITACAILSRQSLIVTIPCRSKWMTLCYSLGLVKTLE